MQAGLAPETECYDKWLSSMMSRVAEHPTANTLCVPVGGQGYSSCAPCSRSHRPRKADAAAIQTIILVDPYVPDEMAAEVQKEFNEKLLGVNTFYYGGDRAYDTALTQILDTPKMVVVVGPQRLPHVPRQRERNNLNTMVALVQVAKMRVEPAELYVVQAFHNAQGEYVNRDEPAADFIVRFAEVVDRMTRWHMEEFYRMRRPGIPTRPPPA